ncbi:hypothetical protein [Microvirga sp. TS319]|uniref:hypothetical protein n=1 Tax=Microvirga sp. TS319 TaxID=3241165 RepID=UPI00351A6169
MSTLYETFLPLVQSLNEYGGNFTAHFVSCPVLDAIDSGASHDKNLADFRSKLLSKMNGWKGLQDHTTFSALFETFYEAVFYLVAAERGVQLQAIPAGAAKGKTPDFQTQQNPLVGFEVKTINVADPQRTYDSSMAGGIDAGLEAQEQAAQSGLGIVARTVQPHGNAKDRKEALEQVMKKVDANVKAGQYQAVPTFLVVSLVRTALHERAENLRKWLPWPGQSLPVNGQLFAVAAHDAGDPFNFFPEWGNSVVDLGPLNRAGILRDHPFIAGMIFVVTEWSKADCPDAVKKAYALNGIWNSEWEADNSFSAEAVESAKSTFLRLCDAWNDTKDTRSAHLPTR